MYSKDDKLAPIEQYLTTNMIFKLITASLPEMKIMKKNYYAYIFLKPGIHFYLTLIYVPNFKMLSINRIKNKLHKFLCHVPRMIKFTHTYQTLGTLF